jgi:hypothetical protein
MATGARERAGARRYGVVGARRGGEGSGSCRPAQPALIGLRAYSFARIGAVLGMTVEDV